MIRSDAAPVLRTCINVGDGKKCPNCWGRRITGRCPTCGNDYEAAARFLDLVTEARDEDERVFPSRADAQVANRWRGKACPECTGIGKNGGCERCGADLVAARRVTQ